MGNIVKDSVNVSKETEVLIINSNLSTSCTDSTDISTIINICSNNTSFLLSGIICGVGNHIVL